jgi:glutamine cyclotransferase
LRKLSGPGLPLLFFGALSLLLLFQGGTPEPAPPGASFASAPPLAGKAPVYKVRIKREILRPEPLFTQGLFFRGGILFESHGLYGSSGLRSYRVAEDGVLETLRVLRFPDSYFAEGSTFAGGLVQTLTWREGTLFRVDADSFRIVESLPYRGEGWGLASDGERLFMSDGSGLIYLRDPSTFRESAPPLKVQDGDLELSQLNELEWDPTAGVLFANLFQSDLAAAVNVATAQVECYLDLGDLRRINWEKTPSAKPRPDVTNGLAVDGEGRLYATGKLWSRLFEIERPTALLPLERR